MDDRVACLLRRQYLLDRDRRLVVSSIIRLLRMRLSALAI